MPLGSRYIKNSTRQTIIDSMSWVRLPDKTLKAAFTLGIGFSASACLPGVENELVTAGYAKFESIGRYFLITQSGAEDCGSPVLSSILDISSDRYSEIDNSRRPAAFVDPAAYIFRLSIATHSPTRCSVQSYGLNDPRGVNTIEKVISPGESLVIEMTNRELTAKIYQSALPIRFETFYYMMSSLNTISGLYRICSKYREDADDNLSNHEENLLRFMASFGFPENEPVPFVPFKNEFELLVQPSDKNSSCRKRISLAASRFETLYGTELKKWEAFNKELNNDINQSL